MNQLSSRTKRYPVRRVARVTIEFCTPLIPGSGKEEGQADSGFVKDVNGFPAIPGTTLAGLLRHTYRESGGDVDSVFGFQNSENSEGSGLSTGWGYIHNSKNQPVVGLAEESDLKDPILQPSSFMIHRDHVRINHQGAAVATGKFDEMAIRAGHRFTFYLELESSEDEDHLWNELLSMIYKSRFRIGGKSRRGWGSFKCLKILHGSYSLMERAGFEDYCKWSGYSQSTERLQSFNSHDEEKKNQLSGISVKLKPEGFWMIGGGSGDETDFSPVLESRIKWQENHGNLGNEEILIPGTSIKGALSHRTAFYYNAFNGNFSDRVDTLEEFSGANNDGVRQLFGYTKGDLKDGDGARGVISINDIYLPLNHPGLKKKHVNHVALDRFTGGARDGALFSEKPFFGGEPFDVFIEIHKDAGIEKTAKRAFAKALKDLVNGRLPLGSGASRGNGIFSGEISWNGVEWNE